MKQFNTKSLNTIVLFLAAFLAVEFLIVLFKDSASPWPWTTTTTLAMTSASPSPSINIEFRKQKRKDEKLDKVEAGLARARALIREAALNHYNNSSPSPSPLSSAFDEDIDYVHQGDIYRNARVFHSGPDNSFWSPLTRTVGLLGSHDPVETTASTSNSSIHNVSSSGLFMANKTTNQVLRQTQVPNSSNPDSDKHVISKASKTTQVVGKRYGKLEKLEAGLARARSSIREAALVKNMTSTHQDPDYVPRGPIYINANAFHRSYLEMEKLFKIYVYEEGELPLFHQGPCKNIYSSEGSLFRDLEFYNIYRTKDSNEALVFFLPFSVVKLVEYLYVPGDYKIPDIGNTVVDYINIISNKYPFWNRSLGADHFMLACHDWGPLTSKFVPNLFHKSIRVLCNANTSEGFNPSKDVTLPGIFLSTGGGSVHLGGLSPSKRSILAFFAGGEHGYIRSLLFKHWKDKDKDIQVHEYLPAGVSYKSMITESKFCLCPSGHEVGSPRIVEAIYGECVPVIIKDGYVPPFSDVLNWKTFSVKVEVKDIQNLKNILMSISQRQYLRLQKRVKQVQRHFVVNKTPKRFDVFHMTVHSIWLRRLNIQIKDFNDQS